IGGSSAAAVRRAARYGPGRQARAETAPNVGRGVSGIKAAPKGKGRRIYEDNNGAAVGFPFWGAGQPGGGPGVVGDPQRTGRDPERHFAIGDAGMMLDRIAQYVEAGASKFILRPAARGDADMLDQTRKLIEQVLPMVAARWPKQKKAA